jgi:hypothetical protein
VVSKSNGLLKDARRLPMRFNDKKAAKGNSIKLSTLYIFKLVIVTISVVQDAIFF